MFGSQMAGSQGPGAGVPGWASRSVPHSVPRWAMIGLAVLLLFGLGTAIHSAGWSQGYTLGLLTGSAGGDSLTPYLVYQAGHGFHPFGFFGAIFRFVALFFVVGLLFKFVRCGRGRMPRGEHFGPWHHAYPYPGAPSTPQPEQSTPGTETPAPPTGSQPTVWTHV